MRVEGIELSWEPDPPPLVIATANRLAGRLADPAFAESTRALDGTAAIVRADTPQAVTISLAEGSAELRRGAAADAEATATIDQEAGGIELSPPQASGSPLGGWLEALLQPPPGPWQQQAERFWSALEAVPGGPAALVAVDTGSGERLRMGAAKGPAVEVHAGGPDLLRLFTAEITLMEGAFEGSVRMRGGFPDLSLFAGAAYRLRYGERGQR